MTPINTAIATVKNARHNTPKYVVSDGQTISKPFNRLNDARAYVRKLMGGRIGDLSPLTAEVGIRYQGEVRACSAWFCSASRKHAERGEADYVIAQWRDGVAPGWFGRND